LKITENFSECIKSTGLTKEVYAEMTSNQVEASTKGKHLVWVLKFMIWVMKNMPCLNGGSDRRQNHCVYFTQNKARFDFTNSDTGVSIYEPLLTHYLGENGQKIFDIETK
jgi:hypothetical protein